MNNKEIRIILASKSPRRRELLGQLFPSFEVVVREVDETLEPRVHPREGVEFLAVRKGAAVAAELPEDVLVISSDTLVELGGVPLGKPADESDAFDMLSRLSGNTHNVHTGVAVHYCGRVVSGVATSSVTFKTLRRDEIDWYISTREPMDKAGAYGIQEKGGIFVRRIEGDYLNVLGLPLCKTYELLRTL